MQFIQTPFFNLTVKGYFLHIETTGVAGAQGEIILVQRHSLWFLSELKHAREHTYTNWAENPYPVECGAELLRFDDLIGRREPCWNLKDALLA
jgi:hypothetical protein